MNMMNDREGQDRLIRQASKQAISLALEGRWQEAAESNKTILESFPNDIDTLNRLGRAHIELGEYAAARAAYARTKELDPYNAIAEKNLRRLERLDAAGESAKPDVLTKLVPNNFIEELGKSGVMRLQQLGSAENLAHMVAGDQVELVVSDGNLHVHSEGGVFLGVVEPRQAQRLMRLMSGGNKYDASVTSSSDDSLTIIIREVYQHPSQMGQLSFPTKGLGGARQLAADRLPYRYSEYDEGLADDAGYSLLSDEEELETESLDDGEKEEEP
jgi:hypothetical protein